MKRRFGLWLALILVILICFGICACNSSDGDNNTTYTVTVIDGDGGGVYKEGTEVTITPTTINGVGLVKFVKWVDENGNELSTSSSYTFEVTEDITITQVWIEIFKIKVDRVGSMFAEKGEEVTITAPEFSKQRFIGWKVGNEIVSTDVTYTFTATKNLVITPQYVRTIKITVIGGSGSGTYDEGTQVTIEAIVPEGKRFLRWVVNGQEFSTNQKHTFTVSFVNLTIEAQFEG